jgi:hypothetical protein
MYYEEGVVSIGDVMGCLVVLPIGVTTIVGGKMRDIVISLDSRPRMAG